ADRIGDIGEYNRNGLGGLEQRRHARVARRDEDIGRARNQAFGVLANCPGVALAPLYLSPKVAALAPAQLLKGLSDNCDPALLFGVWGSVHQHADKPHALDLLCASDERPRRRAAEQPHELASLHSITSSASASRVGGMPRPSAFAALRLMTS